MKFLSAQPDDAYFLWQLQLQLFNFSKLGIRAENIHVLIGYHPQQGPARAFRDFTEGNQTARFFYYPDLRKRTGYPSSIRPHIIAKHFQQFPDLEREAIFYHDADIVFKKLPDFDQLLGDEIWYASDTRSYLDSHHIKNNLGNLGFHQLCALAGIAPEMVEANDAGAGGAQYLLKNIPATFWEKLETDAENIFRFLTDQNDGAGFCDTVEKPGKIQPWCADMWALWWNALLLGRQFHVKPALDFCWSNSPIESLDHAPILHYTGRVQRTANHIFRKENYILYTPFHDDLSVIGKGTCSYFLKELIASYKTDRKKERIDLSDLSFLILVRIDSEDRMENVKTILAYIQQHFKTHIILLEADDSPKIITDGFDQEIHYHFIRDDKPKLHYTRYLNKMIKMAKTPFLALYDTDIIIPEIQIMKAMLDLRQGLYAMVSPYDGSFIQVDSLLKALFMKLQDTALFAVNQGKLNALVKRSYGGVVFVDRLAYIRGGMENEHLTSWGPNDVERVKRMAILGFKVKRIPGNLYHLPHRRGINSGYQTTEERALFIGEYLKISSLTKDELTAYVKTWSWTKNKYKAYSLKHA